MRPITCSRRPEAGFTLIELLAVIIVGGILLTALGSFYLSEQRAFKQQQIQIETSQSLRVAIDQITRDLRLAGRDPLGTDNFGLTYAADDEVRFTADADDDGVVDPNMNERRGFRRSNGTIEMLGDAGTWPGILLADFVDPNGVVFRYYDADGNPVATPTSDPATLEDIRQIDVEITVTQRVPGAPDIARTEASSVELRNLS